MNLPNSDEAELRGLFTDSEGEHEDTTRSRTVIDPNEALKPPPLGKKYASFPALYEDIQSWARSHGYCFVKGSTKRRRIDHMPTGEVYRVILNCDRHRKPRRSVVEPGYDIRERRTTKCNCKFTLTATADQHGQWAFSVTCGEHNHPPSDRPSDHALHRRLERKQTNLPDLLEVQRRNGASARQAYEAIKAQNPDSLIMLSDIRNEFMKISPTPNADGTVGSAPTRYSAAQRVHVLVLLSLLNRPTSSEIYLQTGVPEKSQQYIMRVARSRGYDPKKSPRITDEYVTPSAKYRGGSRPAARQLDNQREDGGNAQMSNSNYIAQR